MPSLRDSAPPRELSNRHSCVFLGRLTVLLSFMLATKGIIDGLWTGERRWIGPLAKDADLWILIWEEIHRVHQEGIFVEVELVKAHRSKKEKQQRALFEKQITEGNEKADELAKDGAMMDKGEMT